MEQASHEKLKQTKNQSSLERFRCVTNFVVIACLLSCVVFLLLSLVSMENRLRVLERNLDEISKELKALKSHQPVDHKRGFGTNERKIKRRKKAINLEHLTVFQRLSHRVDVLESTTTPGLSNRLQGLASRVGVLESNRNEATSSFLKLAERVDILENREANLSIYLETKPARASDDDKLEVTEQALKQFFGKEIVKALRKSIKLGRSIMKGIRLSCLASTKPKSNYLAQKPGRLASGPLADVQTRRSL